MDRFENKKAKQVLLFTDPQGSPLKNRKIRADQISSEFLFGCGAFDTLEIVKPKSEESKVFFEDRMGKFLQLFNYGTLPFYLGRYEPVEGQPMQEETIAAAKWLNAHGVTVKGHPLCWHTACADWLMDYPNEVILEKQLQRIRRDVRAFRGIIDKWDVINEVVIMPEFDKYDNAITRICKQYGRFGLVRRVFEAAKEENPGAELLIISQFTLFADCRSRRPGFSKAARPETAIPLYELVVEECRRRGFKVETGVFAAYMQIASVNDGPVTILLDTKEL